MPYSTTRTIMINFAGSVSGLTSSTQQALGLIDRLGGTVTNIGKAFVSALGLNFKPLLKTVVGGITAFAKVLFLMPAFLLALVNPLNVTTMAFTGFTQALTATDPATYVGATRNMAPAMKDAVAAIRLLEPELKNLYGIVEQNFWSGFTSGLNNLAAIYFPILEHGLGSIASTMGTLLDKFMAFLAEPQVVSAIQSWMTAFSGLGTPLLNLAENLMPTLISLFTAFANILISISPLLTVFANMLGGILNFIAPIISGISGILGGASAIAGSGGGATGGTSGGTGSSGGSSSSGGFSLGGFLGGIWNGITGFVSNLFGGGRAAGGPVFGGYSYLVGERGPEILRMGGGGGGSVSPQVNTGHTFVNVRIGETELRDMVQHEIKRSDQATATVARMGRGLIV
jgi:hypothetical protein